jgi:hypothetical protein
MSPEKPIKALLEPALSGIEALKERKERLGVEPDKPLRHHGTGGPEVSHTRRTPPSLQDAEDQRHRSP